MSEANVEQPENNTEPAEELNLETIYSIPVKITAVIGRCSMSVSQLLKLSKGAVIELDRKVGEPVEIFVNDRLVAKGEIVIVEERIGVTLTELSNKGVEKEDSSVE